MFEIHSGNTVLCLSCGGRMQMDEAVRNHNEPGVCPGPKEQPARQYILHWWTLLFFAFYYFDVKHSVRRLIRRQVRMHRLGKKILCILFKLMFTILAKP